MTSVMAETRYRPVSTSGKRASPLESATAT
jgi:hypothetical protein